MYLYSHVMNCDQEMQAFQYRKLALNLMDTNLTNIGFNGQGSLLDSFFSQ